MRKLVIMDFKGEKAIGMITPDALKARVIHREFGIEFELVIGISDKPLPSPQVMIGRMKGQEKVFEKIYLSQLKTLNIKVTDSVEMRKKVYDNLTREIYFDIKELYQLLV